MKIIPIICCVLSSTILSGCNSTPEDNETWISILTKDEFTDQIDCTITAPDQRIFSSGKYTQTGMLYPFIRLTNGELILGVKSGGKYEIPVGDVQLRVDANTPHLITTAETPVSVKSEVKNPYAAAVENLPPEQQKIVEDAFANASSSTAKMFAPYTATEGEKAKLILTEMLNGKQLIFRQVALANTTSSTGFTTLNKSLVSALSECGYKL